MEIIPPPLNITFLNYPLEFLATKLFLYIPYFFLFTYIFSLA